MVGVSLGPDLNDARTTMMNEVQLDEVVLQHDEELTDRPAGSPFHVFRLIIVLRIARLVILVV
jgi:hypothetical protein